ncbi:MAG: Hint domain-containing protein [Pseudomonadota bacterium]
MESTAELNIDTGASALAMWQTILGPGVNLVAGTASYDGDARSSGIYTGGDATAGRLTPSDSGVILSSGRAIDVTNSGGSQNVRANTTTNTSGDNFDADFTAASGRSTFDASFLEADFTTDESFLSIQFTFASEEYPEFVGSIYNDLVGIWVNGTYVNSPIYDNTQINDLNENENETLYIDNTGGTFNSEMDGLTVTLSVVIPVNPGAVNSLKIGIADVGDSSYDSSVLIAANSIQGIFFAADDTVSALEGRTATVDVLANDDALGTAFVTHINGIEVLPGDSVTLNSGHIITLNPDGTLSAQPPADQVGLTAPESINFTYTADDGFGLTDTAFVTVTAVPCFAAGTLIRTAGGEVPVELLAPGDLVDTRDEGPQPIRWIGRKQVAAQGRFAPILIEPGTFGRHRRLVLSPQHRVLLHHHMAELLFGEDEVLVAAKDLVNEVSVRRLEGGTVTYFHLLFDCHQLIWSDGLLTESFLPGPYSMTGLEAEIREEIVSIFPELDPETGRGYGPSVRRGLKSYEVRALLG